MIFNLKNTKFLQNGINRVAKKRISVGLQFSVDIRDDISNKIYGFKIPKASYFKLLGLIIQKNFKFTQHVRASNEKLSKDLQLRYVGVL